MWIHIDVPADLNSENETGYVWTFLDEAADPSLVVPGALVITGDVDNPAVASVVDVVDHPSGAIVVLDVLPGELEGYMALARRVEGLASGPGNP